MEGYFGFFLRITFENNLSLFVVSTIPTRCVDSVSLPLLNVVFCLTVTLTRQVVMWFIFMYKCVQVLFLRQIHSPLIFGFPIDVSAFTLNAIVSHIILWSLAFPMTSVCHALSVCALVHLQQNATHLAPLQSPLLSAQLCLKLSSLTQPHLAHVQPQRQPAGSLW